MDEQVDSRSEDILDELSVFREKIISESPVGISIYDDTGQCLLANNSLASHIGATVDQVLAQNFHHIASWQNSGLLDTAMTALRDNRKLHHEVVLTTSFGKRMAVSCDFSPFYVRGRQYLLFMLDDITERKRMELQIRKLAQVVEQSPVSVVITDADANIEYVNTTFEQITGYSEVEVREKNPRVLKSGHTPKWVYEDLWQTLRKGKVWKGEFQNRRKNGEIFWEYAHIAPMLDETGMVQNYLAVKEDITLRKQQEEHILHQAHFDALTNLPNRFLALDRLSRLIIEAERDGELVAVLFLDLDDFKKINDTLGHEMGDRLLIDASERLREAVRNSDTVGRLGGDEFIILLGGLDNASGAQPVMESLLEQFRDPFRINERELVLTASIGVAVYPDDAVEASELLRKADAAMYHSKDQGRNTYSYFTEAMNRDVLRRLALEEQMHGALERNEFRLCYQPQIDVASGCIIGLEALLRWRNSALGEVSPIEFIPIAEQTGLIVPIGKFVIREALASVARWQTHDEQPLRMAVNLSPRQFRDPGLVDFIRGELTDAGVPGELLELEITEGVLMSGHAYIDDALTALHELNVLIAMDDFGTGYSSLSYLRNYPFDVLKVDRSFIHDIMLDNGDRELINAAVAMAHGLGLKVVAEGVETEEQLAYLATLDCEFAQGYLFSKPLEAAEIEGFLRNKPCR